MLLLVYRPALDGPFLSDDDHYVENNPFVHGISVENLTEILHPNGAATAFVANYAPVHLILHMCAWEVFGEKTRGHHLVNIVLHAVVAALLVALLLQSGVPRGGALFGGFFFLIHPANVEVVAWISQLKSISALVLSLAALLVFPRFRWVAALLFALGLLAKPLAAFALPVAFLLEWVREGRVRWLWLVVWIAILGVFATVEFGAYQRFGAAEASLLDSPFVLVRTTAAIAMRYLVMAVSSYGVSAFQEPLPAYSPSDLWWLFSIFFTALLACRIWVAARRRKRELAWWTWALAAYVPVSPIFPFLYPVADRYLYFILPGLIGGVLLMASEAVDRFASTSIRSSKWPLCGALSLAVVVLVVFATRSVERARIWQSSESLVADAAAHYPEGVSANLVRASEAAEVRDVDAAVRALRAAAARGYNRYERLLSDPDYAPIRDQAEFRAVVYEIAGSMIALLHRYGDLSQLEYLKLFEAHAVRNEQDAAIEALERALEAGGPFDDKIRAILDRRSVQP